MKKINVDKMTVKELYAAHQELWFWLADNPDMGKQDWPGWEKYLTRPIQDCFACEIPNSCLSCFLGRSVCGSGGLFDSWVTETNLNVREVLADLIATIPLKKKHQKVDK